MGYFHFILSSSIATYFPLHKCKASGKQFSLTCKLVVANLWWTSGKVAMDFWKKTELKIGTSGKFVTKGSLQVCHYCQSVLADPWQAHLPLGAVSHCCQNIAESLPLVADYEICDTIEPQVCCKLNINILFLELCVYTSRCSEIAFVCCFNHSCCFCLHFIYSKFTVL